MALKTTKQTRSWDGSYQSGIIKFQGTARLSADAAVVENYSLSASVSDEYAGSINFDIANGYNCNIPANQFLKKEEIDAAIIAFKNELEALYL